jgi:hypothetical protein
VTLLPGSLASEPGDGSSAKGLNALSDLATSLADAGGNGAQLRHDVGKAGPFALEIGDGVVDRSPQAVEPLSTALELSGLARVVHLRVLRRFADGELVPGHGDGRRWTGFGGWERSTSRMGKEGGSTESGLVRKKVAQQQRNLSAPCTGPGKAEHEQAAASGAAGSAAATEQLNGC